MRDQLWVNSSKDPMNKSSIAPGGSEWKQLLAPPRVHSTASLLHPRQNAWLSTSLPFLCPGPSCLPVSCVTPTYNPSRMCAPPCPTASPGPTVVTYVYVLLLIIPPPASSQDPDQDQGISIAGIQAGATLDILRTWSFKLQNTCARKRFLLFFH